MSKLNADELNAWDQYAATALRSVITGRPISADEAAKMAAGVADQMIFERRERLEGKKKGFFDLDE